MEDNAKRSILRNGNFQDSIFVGLFSAVLLSYSLYHHYFDRNTSEWKMSPFLFPVLISIFGLLLALSLIADARREIAHPEEGRAGSVWAGKNLIGAIVLVAVSIVYYAIMPLIRFIPATLIYLAVLFFYLGERKIWKIALLSIVTTAAVYGMFAVGLNVRLP